MNILVIGEKCTDKWVFGSVPRVNPEAPCLIFQPGLTETNFGMAGNVAANLRYFGANVSVAHSGQILKTRFVDSASGTILLRVDEFDSAPAMNVQDIEMAVGPIAAFDAVVISDYCKGMLAAPTIMAISLRAKLTFLDTKKVLDEWADEIDFIKINEREHQANLKESNYLLRCPERLIVTLGVGGASHKGVIYPTERVDVRSLCGAGDTFLAALTTEYLTSGDIAASIRKANRFAGLSCTRKGVVQNFDFANK